MLTFESEYGTVVEEKKPEGANENQAPKSLSFDDVYGQVASTTANVDTPPPAEPTDSSSSANAGEKKEEGYSEADYEAAAHAIATLESMKVNLNSIHERQKVIDSSVAAMAINTCGTLTKRFCKQDAALNLESEQGVFGIIDETIAKITTFKQTQTTK